MEDINLRQLTHVSAIGGYKEIILNFIRMYGLTNDEGYLQKAGEFASRLVKEEELLHKCVLSKPHN